MYVCMCVRAGLHSSWGVAKRAAVISRASSTLTLTATHGACLPIGKPVGLEQPLWQFDVGSNSFTHCLHRVYMLVHRYIDR